MKFVYFGYDFMLDVVHRLMEDGHQPVAFFTFDCDNVFNFNQNTIALAEKLDIPAFTEAAQSAHIEEFTLKGAQVFIAAGYPYKIPPPDETRAYGLNIHPSYLPKGRGIMPVPYIITRHPEAAGFTIHKLSEKFDRGDIVHQEAFKLLPHENVETLSARIALRAPEALAEIIRDLPRFWSEAKAQNPDEALHFPPPDDAMRTLDWTQPVSKINGVARAFGRFGALAHMDSGLWVVYDLDVWPEEHSHRPGAVVYRQNKLALIAALDGYVCLKDFHKAHLG